MPTATETIAQVAVGTHGAIQKPTELAAFLDVIGQVDVIVEIGSYAGGTLYAWSQCAASVIAVDLPPTGIYAATGEGKNPHGAAWVFGDSHDLATVETLKGLLQGRAIDVLFIDGDHSYRGVKSDLEMYSPLVKPGGLIALHDIVDHPTQPDIEVSRLWAEVKTPDAIEIIDTGSAPWGGIGVLHATGN